MVKNKRNAISGVLVLFAFDTFRTCKNSITVTKTQLTNYTTCHAPIVEAKVQVYFLLHPFSKQLASYFTSACKESLCELKGELLTGGWGVLEI